MRKPLVAATLGFLLCSTGCKSRQDEAGLAQAKALTAEKPKEALEKLDRLPSSAGNRLEVAKAKAAAHQRLKQLDEAEKLLREVLAETPADHEALLQLANVSIARGNLDLARRHLTVAIRHQPPHVPTLLLFATVATSKEDGNAGLTAFEGLVGDSFRSFRRSAEYVVARASLLAARGDGRAAVDAWLQENDKSRSFDPKLSLLMADGLARLEKGHLALWILARASSSPSAGADVHEALAERALSMGEVGLAEQALTRLGGELSRTPSMLILEARLLELQDQGLEATKLTKRALDLVPRERSKQKTAYALVHARSLAKEGLLDQARQVLTEVLKGEPDHGQAKLLLAAIELQAGHADRVEALVTGLLGDARYSAQAQTLVVRTHIARKDAASAKKAARLFFEKQPDDLHARLLLAQTLAELGESSAALELLDSAPPASARAATLVRLRVQLAEKVASPARVEELVSEYLRQGLKSPELQHALARAFIRQKRLGDAEAVFRELAKEDPNSLEEVARLQREQGRLADAISTLEELVGTSPSSHSAWLVLALMRREAGSVSGAIEAYEQALRLQPNDPVALNNLAVLLLEQPETRPRAVSLGRRAVAAFSDNPALEDTLGWALLETGEEKYRAEATVLLERSCRLLGTPEATFHYGVALARMSRTKEAKERLSAALRLDSASGAPPPPWRSRAEQALRALP